MTVGMVISVLCLTLILMSKASVMNRMSRRNVLLNPALQRRMDGTRTCFGQKVPRSGPITPNLPIETPLSLVAQPGSSAWESKSVVLSPFSMSLSKNVYKVRSAAPNSETFALFRPDAADSRIVSGQVNKDASLKERFAYVLSTYLGARIPYTEVVTIDGQRGSLQVFLKDAKQHFDQPKNDKDTRALGLLDILLVGLERMKHNRMIIQDETNPSDNRVFGRDNGWCLPGVHCLDTGDQFTTIVSGHLRRGCCYWNDPSLEAPIDVDLLEKLKNLPVYDLASQANECGIRPSFINSFILSAEFARMVVMEYDAATVDDLHQLRREIFNGDIYLIPSVFFSDEFVSQDEYAAGVTQFLNVIRKQDSFTLVDGNVITKRS